MTIMPTKLFLVFIHDQVMKGEGGGGITPPPRQTNTGLTPGYNRGEQCHGQSYAGPDGGATASCQPVIEKSIKGLFLYQGGISFNTAGSLSIAFPVD